MIVAPGIRRFIGNLQRYFLPLLSDLTVAKGLGTFTFTRSTTDTYVNHEGKLTTTVANSPSFNGLRGVTNLAIYSDTPSNAAWTKQANVSVTGIVATFTGTTSTSLYQSTGATQLGAPSQPNTVVFTLSGTAGETIRISSQSNAGNTFATITLTASPVRYAVSSVFGTAGSINAAIDRPSVAMATVVNVHNLAIYSGSIQDYVATTTAPNTAFFDYANPNTVDVNGVVTDSGVRTPVYTSAGLQIMPAGVNVFANPDTPATQSITVTAVPYTLSFYGTGNIVRSGVSSGTLTGTGTDNRVQVTFTPTAGSLTLTLSGTITHPQLEANSFATSAIYGTGATSSRGASIATGSTASLPTSGRRVIEFNWTPAYSASSAITEQVLFSSYTSSTTELSIRYNGIILYAIKAVTGSPTEYVTIATSVTQGTTYRIKLWVNADNTMSLALNDAWDVRTSGVTPTGLGSELYTNKDFQSGDTGWSKGTGVTIVDVGGGVWKAVFTATATGSIYQASVITNKIINAGITVDSI
jgi:hypothetical protein